MGRVNSYEIIENDVTYIINEYENGTIEKFIKAEPISINTMEESLSQSDIQEQILLNTEYLVAIQEISMM